MTDDTMRIDSPEARPYVEAFMANARQVALVIDDAGTHLTPWQLMCHGFLQLAALGGLQDLNVEPGSLAGVESITPHLREINRNLLQLQVYFSDLPPEIIESLYLHTPMSKLREEESMQP